VVRHPIRLLLDGKDFYEQIRVVEEHVPRTLFVTPDGTMESLVPHQGDLNWARNMSTVDESYIRGIYWGLHECVPG
jgi:hypothetical protein